MTAQTEPAAPDGTGNDENLVLSYIAVRQALGLLGLSLPLSLLAFGLWSPSDFASSISGFYYTPMGGVLTGILTAIGVFLCAYRGYPRQPGEWLSDRWLARLAGLAAIGVALMPIGRAGYPVCVQDPAPVCWRFGFTFQPDLAHYAAAVLFFTCMALIALVQFPRGERDADGRLCWTLNTWIYLSSGGLIVASMAAVGLYFLTTGAARAAMDAARFLFWSESVGILAFSAAWLVKGKALRMIAALRPGD
ncbi:hypothetical protein [Albidovulum sp.]